MRRRRALVLAALVVAAAFFASASHACPVCFGDVDHPIVEGLQASILFLIGVTYFVILSGVAAFLLLRRRANRLASQTTETSQGALP
jgi:hypothetical protein